MYNAQQGREVVGRRLLSEKVVSRGGNCVSSRWNTTGGKSLASRYDEAKGSAPESTGRVIWAVEVTPREAISVPSSSRWRPRMTLLIIPCVKACCIVRTFLSGVAT
jgi:hypothetical protein